MAPEVKAGRGHDMSVDVWALGQMAYQLLCCPTEDNVLTCLTEDSAGEVISRSDQLQALKAEAGNSYWRDGELSESFKDLIALMVMPDPSHRPTMEQIVQYPAFTRF